MADEKEQKQKTKQLEMRKYNSKYGLYYYLTYDVTEEVREMFGVPIKEAFAVYKRASERQRKYFKDYWDNPPKTLNVWTHRVPNGLTVGNNEVQIPDMNEVYVVFDDNHTVCFWTSEWGGMKKTSLDDIDFSG